MNDSMRCSAHLKVCRTLELQLLIFLVQNSFYLILSSLLRFPVEFQILSFYFFLTWLLEVAIVILKHVHQIAHI